MQTFDFFSAPISTIADVVTNEYNVPTDWTGIRVFESETEPKAGDKLDCSRRWEDNNLTDEYEDGTCAVQIDWRASDLNTEIKFALKVAQQYCGDYIAVIGGPSATYGVDNHEVIIRDAVILAVWKMEN
jgi:hypothetical protein